MPLDQSSHTVLRRATGDDVSACGRLIYEAFTKVAEDHGALSDCPTAEQGCEWFKAWISGPDSGSYVVIVGVLDGQAKQNRVQAGSQEGIENGNGNVVLGVSVLSVRAEIHAVGPFGVHPTCQSRGVGNKLMLETLKQSRKLGGKGIRLVQAAYNCGSMAFYTKLGFTMRELLLCMNGSLDTQRNPDHDRSSSQSRDLATGRKSRSHTPAAGDSDHWVVETPSPADMEGCNTLCGKVLGFQRHVELSQAVAARTAKVVRSGKGDQGGIAGGSGTLLGYTTNLGYFGHSVAETNQDMVALIMSACRDREDVASGQSPDKGKPQEQMDMTGAGIIIPAKNHDLVKSCLARGLVIKQTLTLMTLGEYVDPTPRGVWLPSVLY